MIAGLIQALISFISLLVSFILTVFGVVLTVAKSIFDALQQFVATHKEFSLGFLLCFIIFITGIVSCHFIDNNDIPPKVIRSWDVRCIQVIDGNHIVVKAGLFDTKKKIVLSKVKAPSLEQPIGEDAKKFLEQLVLGLRLRVDQFSDDVKFSGIVYNSFGQCVQREMVRNGFAWRTADLWYQEEKEARQKKRGIWSVYSVEKVKIGDHAVDQRLGEDEK